MSADPAAVDTNVLVYSHFPTEPHYAASYALLQRAARGEIPLRVFPQNVSEFISVVTNPKRVNPAKTVPEAVKAIQTVLASPGISLLPYPDKATATFLNLLLTHPTSGPRIFDRQLVAAMTEHGIGTIYTFNVKDFTGLPGITPIDPASLLTAPPPGAP